MKLNKELLLTIVVFFIGCIFGLMFSSVTSIDFDPKISISDIFSMALTSAIGIYLGITISNRQSSSRFEKDFLISEVKRITEYIDSTTFFKNTEEFKLEEATKSFKELNIRLINFESILSDARYCEGLDSGGLRNAFKNFRCGVTDLKLQNGLIRPNSSERSFIIKKYTDFRKEIFKMITSINSHEG
jgi:hypothetical protein